MKKARLFLFALLASATLTAANTTQTVAQVTGSVDLTTDVDYVVTSTTPFTTAGSVNIRNTEHAVLILKNIRPSTVISDWLGHVYINGDAAQNGVNCQVKMYAQGAIVLPYGSGFLPLTCYTEENYAGESSNNYTEGHAGGYMKTLTPSLLNNRIRSFKLKRGYMVTFAVGTAGWGYSRCFIADKADLEVASVPAPLNGKISSYRLFKWQNAQKKGLASDTNLDRNRALGSSWCYDWAVGWDMGPDVECVPHHIYEDWPSSSACGSATWSCHMKTNNEPGNSADDRPQSVATVLANWENLMRTGMRLCSESSHDGSMSHLKEFIDAIDARGWRCDLLDLHCYWPSSTFNSLTWYSDHYGNGRPIWISEWLWGASWNSNGIFGAVSDWDSYSAANQQACYNGTKPILELLNSHPRVERYAYWNSERNCSKIYNNGLSTLGKYYASMESGLGYNASNEFVPRIVYKNPSELTGTYTKKTGTYTLAWTDPNGDMLDSIVVEWKQPGSALWSKRANVQVKDKSSGSDLSYTWSDEVKDPGIYYYRVAEYYDGGKRFNSSEVSVTVATANNVGALFYGQMKLASTDVVTTDIEMQDKAPYAVMGMVSNKNASNGITNQVTGLARSSFKFRLYPWTLTEPVSLSGAESVDFLLLPPDTIFHLSDDMMLISQKAGMIKGDEVQVTFPQAFPEGVVPVVVAQQNTSITSYAPVTVKVYDVTNTGFKARLVRQEAVTTAFNAQNVNYFACSPGQVAIGGGKLLTVGRDTETPVGGSARQTVYFKNAGGEQLYLQNPIIIAAPQTHNYAKASVFRIHSLGTEGTGVVSASVRRQVDGTSTVTETNLARTNGDYIGWMILSDDPDGTGDEQPLITPTGIEGVRNQAFSVSVSDRVLWASGPNLRAYNLQGQSVSLGQPLPQGLYIVTNGRQTQKVQVK